MVTSSMRHVMPVWMLIYIAKLVIWLQDQYIGVVALCKKYAFSILVWYVYTKRKNTSNVPKKQPKLLLAIAEDNSDDIDVTYEVSLFYRYDKLISVASLYRWLRGFNYSVKTIELIWQEDSMIYSSFINLHNDVELRTLREIPSGDMNITNLPKTRLVPESI